MTIVMMRIASGKRKSRNNILITIQENDPWRYERISLRVIFLVMKKKLVNEPRGL